MSNCFLKQPKQEELAKLVEENKEKELAAKEAQEELEKS